MTSSLSQDNINQRIDFGCALWKTIGHCNSQRSAIDQSHIQKPLLRCEATRQALALPDVPGNAAVRRRTVRCDQWRSRSVGYHCERIDTKDGARRVRRHAQCLHERGAATTPFHCDCLIETAYADVLGRAHFRSVKDIFVQNARIRLGIIRNSSIFCL